MAAEHERKFLLTGDGWRAAVLASTRMVQGYLQQQDNCSVRVRICSEHMATINIKSATPGISRHEFEYSIPADDAKQMLELLCRKPLIEKVRHLVDYDGFKWEIDEFNGCNEGLIVAELELQQPQQKFTIPPWLGKEVSDDLRYYNTCLQQRPYNSWHNS